jgi:hypothetical protein
MTTTDPRPAKRPRPRFDLTGPEWKLALTGALGLAWTVAWLALAKPAERASLPAEAGLTGAPPRGGDALAKPVQQPPRATPAAPRVAAADPARTPRRAAIRVRTRSS